jgi:hypothetical protein
MEWANKAEALASYGKQADDKALFNYATRIQARAVRRCGELLKQFNGRGRNQYTEDEAPHGPTQKQQAEEAGLSKKKTKTAVNVANVPEKQFETAIESQSPPSITNLAKQGVNSQPKPEGFTKATHLIGTVKRFAEFCEDNDPVFVAGGVLPSEISELKRHVQTIDNWLDRFVVNLER